MITRITIEFQSQNESEADEVAKQLAADAETALIEARVVRIYPPKIETFSERRDSLDSFNAWQQAQAAQCVLWLQSVEERARSWQNANPAAAANLRDLAYDRSLFFYERVKWAQVSKGTCTAFICARLRAMNNAGHSEQVEDELEYLCGSLNVSIKDKAVQAAWCEAKEAMGIHCDIYDDLQVSEPQL